MPTKKKQHGGGNKVGGGNHHRKANLDLPDDFEMPEPQQQKPKKHQPPSAPKKTKAELQQEKANKISGRDTNGRDYDTVEEMWSRELKGDLDDRKTGWYGKAIDYWSKVPATRDGVLGGLSEIHEVDVKESILFLKAVTVAHNLGRARALDCGAGIGRLTKHVLLPLGFAKVDLLEPLQHMVDEALNKELVEDKDRIGTAFVTSMQKVQLTELYDVILIQWAAIYLTDNDFISFLKHCAEHLAPDGIVYFKENCSAGTDFVVDKDDSSLTRSDLHYKKIFAAANMHVVAETNQRDWPKTLFLVKMYALRANVISEATANGHNEVDTEEAA